MLRIRSCYMAFALCVALSFQSGCLALSFGGKSQQVDTVMTENPQTQERLGKLEARVEALEQQFSPQLPPMVKP